MKRFAFAFLLCALSAHATEVRTWTSNDGRTLEASLAEVVTAADGSASAVKVRPTAGGELVIPLTSLAEEDQKFIAEMLKVQEEEAQKAKLADRKAKWTEDWEEAKQESEETGLPILLLMTGSDWCGYCIELHANVFDDREFQKYADQNLVLMKADFPNKAQKRATKEQNAQLKEEFELGGYPTVHLVRDGKSVGKIGGYGGDSPKEYVAKIAGKLQ